MSPRSRPPRILALALPLGLLASPAGAGPEGDRGPRREATASAPWSREPLRLGTPDLRPSQAAAPLAFDRQRGTVLTGGPVARRFELATGRPRPLGIPAPARRATLVLDSTGHRVRFEPASGAAALVQVVSLDAAGAPAKRIWVPAGAHSVDASPLGHPVRAAVSPSGRWLATTRGPELQLQEVTGGAPRTLPFTAARLWALGLAFSADSETLALNTRKMVTAYDVESGGRLGAVTSTGVFPGTAVFAPVGHSVTLVEEVPVGGGRCPRLVAWAPGSPELRVLRPASCEGPRTDRLAWSPDGATLYQAGSLPEEDPPVLRTIRLAGEEAPPPLDPPPAPLAQMRVSPDGRYLAGTSARGLHLWELARGAMVPGGPGSVASASPMRFETGPGEVLQIRRGDQVERVDLVTGRSLGITSLGWVEGFLSSVGVALQGPVEIPREQLEGMLTEAGERMGVPRASRPRVEVDPARFWGGRLVDGEQALVFQTRKDQVVVVDLEGLAVTRRFRWKGTASQLALSRDGSTLAALTGDRLQLVPTRGPVTTLDLAAHGDGAAATAVQLSRDGSRLAVGYQDGVVRIWSR